jgi:hypothetical protein
MMDSPNDQFSIPEFVVASIAMAVVAVVAFEGISGSRDANPYATNFSRAHLTPATGRSLQVSAWRLDDASAPSRPYRPSDVVAVRKSGSSGPGPAAPAKQPGRSPVEPPASTFFKEATPATVVEMRMPDIGGPPPPLIGPPELFRMKNAIVPPWVKPIKEASDSAASRVER